MTAPFVIDITIKLFKAFTPLFYLLAYIFCLPQFLLMAVKLKFFNKSVIRNYIQLTTHFIFYLLYIGTYFNLHFIIYFKYYLDVDSTLQLILSFFILNTLTAVIYKLTDINFFIWTDTPYLLFLASYEIIWIFLFICFFIRFGDLSLLDFLVFKRIYLPHEFLNLFLFSALTIGDTLALILVHVFIILHVVNPISIIRGVSLVKNEYNWHLFRTVLTSTLYILQDFLLIIAYLFNMIFFKSFVQTHIKCISILMTAKYKKVNFQDLSPFETSISYSKLYLYIKHHLILNNFKKNIRLFVGIFFSVFTIIFFWKLPAIYRELKKLWENDDLKDFGLNYALHIIDGFIEVIFPVIWIYNHVIPFNYLSLYKIKNYYRYGSGYVFLKNDSKELNMFFLNMFIFIQKGLDYAYAVLSFTKISNFTFIIYLIRSLKKRRISFSTFFPLLIESEYFIENGCEEYGKKPITGKNKNLEIFDEYLSNRRKKLFRSTIHSNISSFFILLTLPSLINPFYGIRYVKNLYTFIYNSLMSSRLDYIDPDDPTSEINCNFSTHQKILKIKFSKNNKKLLIDLIWYIPINILVGFTAPWCLYDFAKFIYHNSIKSPIVKIKKHNTEIMKDNLIKIKNKTLTKDSKQTEFTYKMVTNWVRGWKFIIQMLLVHLFVIRGILLWQRFFDLKKYKEEKSRRQLEEIKIENKTSEKSIFKEATLKRQIYSNTEKFLNETNFELIEYILENNTILVLKELIFYPFLLIITVLTPWNVFLKEVNSFFKSNKLKHKTQHFIEITKIFYSDILTMCIAITVFFSLVNTFKLLALLYYAFRKTILRDEYSILLYNTYYKNDFKAEVNALSAGIIKKISIFILIVLNILLITRILPVYRRMRRFILAHLAKDLSRFKHLFDPKIKVEHHYFQKLSNPALVSIFQYLSPDSIYKLILTYNKTVYNKTQMNLVWQNMFENYYRQKLKNSTTPEIYNLFENQNNIENYKQLCKDASSCIGKKVTLSEAERDYMIGPMNVMIEETFESLLKLPHLILTPVKILSYFINLFTLVIVNIQLKFQKSPFYQNYLRLTYFALNENTFRESDNYFKNEKYFLFFNLQVLGLLNLLGLIVLFFINIFSSIFSIYVIIIKIFSLVRIIIPRDVPRMSYRMKVQEINNSFIVIYQKTISFLIIILHVTILALPTIYLHREGFDNLVETNFSTLLHFFNPLNYMYFFEQGFEVFWNKGFFGRPRFLLGSYCSNLILYGLNCFIITFLTRTFSKTHVIIYDIVSCIFLPNGLLKYIFGNTPFIFNSLLFPQVYLLSKINELVRQFNLADNKLFNFAFNIIILLIMIFPFCLNFTMSLKFFKIFILNSYAVINMVKVVKMMKR